MGILNNYKFATHMVGSFQGSGTLTSDVSRIDVFYEQALLNGNAPSVTNANQPWTDSRTISAYEILDLSSGLIDVFGTELSFTTIKAIAIKNNTSDTLVTISGDFVDIMFGKADSQFTVSPTGWFSNIAPIDGWAVTGSSNEIMVLPSAELTYEISIVGIA